MAMVDMGNSSSLQISGDDVSSYEKVCYVLNNQNISQTISNHRFQFENISHGILL